MFRLRELRTAKNMNQEKLAIMLNVSQSAVSDYENGVYEPDIRMLIRIADIFHVSVDYLIGNSDNPHNYSEYDLSPEESNLIYTYKRLGDIKKAKLMAYAEGLAEK